MPPNCASRKPTAYTRWSRICTAPASRLKSFPMEWRFPAAKSFMPRSSPHTATTASRWRLPWARSLATAHRSSMARRPPPFRSPNSGIRLRRAFGNAGDRRVTRCSRATDGKLLLGLILDLRPRRIRISRHQALGSIVADGFHTESSVIDRHFLERELSDVADEDLLLPEWRGGRLHHHSIALQV